MLEAYTANNSGILPFLHKSFIDLSGKTKYKKYKWLLIQYKSTSQVKAQMRTFQICFEDH